VEWIPAVISGLASVLLYGLGGLAVAGLIKFVRKQERLPRWPIYAGAALGLLTVAGALFVVFSANDGPSI
jgi:hypothetical protein